MGSTNTVALSLATAMQRSLDAAANNLANASTAGFKAIRPVFDSMTPEASSDSVSTNYVRENGTYIDLTQGGLVATHNALDLAISGNGWFSFQSADGQVSYGRNGRLAVDVDGQLASLSGAPILDEGGSPITIPEDVDTGSLVVARDGTITDSAGGSLGRVGMFTVPDPNVLIPVGGGQYALPIGSAAAIDSDQSQLMQGYVEQSNVQPVSEMVRLIDVQRTYERAVQVMSDTSTLTQQAVRRIAKTV